MSLPSLLNSETIHIDNHGQGMPIDIDDRGIHLHKRFNGNASKSGYAEVRIPLNGGDIQVVDGKGKNSGFIVSEIKRAFKDPRKRVAFVKSLRRELENLAMCSERYCRQGETKELNEEGLRRVDEIIYNVASMFGATANDKKELLYSMPDKVAFHYVRMRKTRRHGILRKELFQDAFVYRGMEHHLYVLADLRELSFTLTRARYMLE